MTLKELINQINNLEVEIKDLTQQIIWCENALIRSKSKSIPCIKNVKSFGWTPTTKLGEGLMGDVYEACRGLDCNYVMKVYEIDRTTGRSVDEGRLTNEAGKIGVGPRVYRYNQTCKHNGKDYSWIIAEKLKYTLYDKYKRKDGFDHNDITKALNLYWNKLYANTNILQKDFKSPNIMFDERDRMYLIDYGIATQTKLRDKHKQSHLCIVINKLLQSMFYGEKYWNAPPLWSHNTDKAKYRDLINCIIMAKRWLKSNGFNANCVSIESITTYKDKKSGRTIDLFKNDVIKPSKSNFKNLIQNKINNDQLLKKGFRII